MIALAIAAAALAAIMIIKYRTCRHEGTKPSSTAGIDGQAVTNSTPLHVTFSEQAYKDLWLHAKDKDLLVCGVLVGNAHANSEGLLLNIKATIQGRHTRQTSNTVTFTRETWISIDTIHKRDYPEEKIVGWYHSCLGNSAALSSESRFIQENFFSSPTQVTVVVNSPLKIIAIYANSEKGIVTVDRFSVSDGNSVREVETQGVVFSNLADPQEPSRQ